MRPQLVVLFVLLLIPALITSPAKAEEPIIPEMVLIPSGWFVYGATPNHILRSWEILKAFPAQTIFCPTFSISIYEVTTAEMRKFILDGGYDHPEYWPEEAQSFLPGYRSAIPARYPNDRCPCTGVTYYEADAYCAWLAHKTGRPYRLPTEIEWEKAARGTDGRIFPWGNQWDPSACNWNDDTTGNRNPDGLLDGNRHVAFVDDYPQGISPYGCFNMAGNAWEWCASWFDSEPDCNFRVLRGGCYDMIGERHFRTFARRGAKPEIGVVFHDLTGFRIALSEE